MSVYSVTYRCNLQSLIIPVFSRMILVRIGIHPISWKEEAEWEKDRWWVQQQQQQQQLKRRSNTKFDRNIVFVTQFMINKTWKRKIITPGRLRFINQAQVH